MQYWILFHLRSGEKLTEYTSLAGARRGMRASNRNAGWTRGSRCTTGCSTTGLTETEWCHWTDNTDQWGYGPYAIASEQNWRSIKR